MSDSFISSRNQTWLRDSVLESFIDTYLDYLINLGYSEQSVRTYGHSVAHFAYWLRNKNLSLDRINEVIVDKFLFKHLPACECSHRCSRTLVNVRAALRHLLKVLRIEEKIPACTPKLHSSISEELNRYDTYLQEVRGLTEATRINRSHYAEKFLTFKFGKRSIDLTQVNERDMQCFVAKIGKGFKPSSIQVIAGALRSYLRYRALLGDRTEPLIASVPSVAQWRLATLPKALSSSDIKRLFNSFDRTTAIGQRDYAITRCLLDLGLRACEVAQLQIDDIDWHRSTLLIKSAKSHREQLLPLPAQTGEAIVDYLRHGRPSAQCRSLFVRHRGPVNSAMSSGVVCSRVRAASARCHMDPVIGAHVYRHTAACQMLRAGASLKGIADILRHRRLDTTMIYAKIDVERLTLVAAPWPGRPS